MTGVAQKIGNMISYETQGATITYGGTIKEIYKRMNIIPSKNIKNLNIDVFICDTEGLYDDEENSSIASLLLPLLIISSKIVAFLQPQPENSLIRFLGMCKNYILISNKKANDPFASKLLVRFVDYPPLNKEYTEEEVNMWIKTIKSEVKAVQYFKNQLIEPIFIPGGPFNHETKCHKKIFTKIFLDNLFNKINNTITYNSPQIFVNSIKNVISSPLCDYKNIMFIFKEKNHAEKILDLICIKIEGNINDYFRDCMEKMEYDQSSNQNFYEINVVQELITRAKRSKINKKYLSEYIEKEKNYFNDKENELYYYISRYEEFKENIDSFNNQKEKIIKTLAYISQEVKKNAESAADYIFYNVQNRYSKIKKNEGTVLNEINGKCELCINKIITSHIKYNELKERMTSDVISIFDKFCQFKNFTFYREHGVISRIISFFFDSVEEKAEADEIAPDVWGVVNIKTDKYCRIVVKPRKYEEKLLKSLNQNIKKDILQNLDSDQKNRIYDFMKKENKLISKYVNLRKVDHIILHKFRDTFSHKHY